MDSKGRPDQHDTETIHPYQWVETRNSEKGEQYNKLGADSQTARHDVYLPDRHTGRLICTLKPRSPLVVGATQEQRGQDAPTDVMPYLDPVSGEPAIPGSSIKGMISAVAEAISGSALRVLNDGFLSQRTTASKGLKKIGRIERNNKGQWHLHHLGEVSEKNTSGKGGASPDKILRVLHADAQWPYEARCWCFGEDGMLNFPANSSIEGTWYTVRPQNPSADHFLPTQHKYTLWIPTPNRSDPNPDQVTAAVVDSFARLLFSRVRNRVESEKKSPLQSPPYLPPGYENGYPIGSAESNDWTAYQEEFDNWLSGKLVYYCKENGNVDQISFSAIWRVIYTADTIHSTIDSDLLPWGADARNNCKLSPAEALFGVVEDRPAKHTSASSAQLLAGRVRVSDAIADEPVRLLPRVVLRALSSPKPPSPALYFKRAGRGPAAANGRKFYVPQKNQGQWERHPDSDTAEKYSVACKPIAGSEINTFWFHLDVHNLSNAEMGLLIRALQPTASHVHMLGLGKPLGLGNVKIEIAGFWKRDTDQPIRLEKLRAPRYTQWFAVHGKSVAPSVSRYPTEAATPPSSETIGETDEYIDKELLDQLATIGDPENTNNKLVWYPLINGNRGEAADDKGYSWFVANGKREDQKQSLTSVQPGGLGTLKIL